MIFQDVPKPPAPKRRHTQTEDQGLTQVITLLCRGKIPFWTAAGYQKTSDEWQPNWDSMISVLII